jgi:ABC-type nitrate/sulfonate/bicarbonate transport system substrate-binding protein
MKYLPSFLAKTGMAAIFAASFVAAPKAMAADTISYGMVGGNGLEWILAIGQDKGFFAKDNINLETISLPNSSGVQQQVAGGSVNMGGGGYVDPIRAIDKGADVALLLTRNQSPPYQLMVSADIKSMADLKGKSISVGGAQDITRIYLDRMLATQGLKTGDYDLIYAGSSGARFAALQSGGVAGAILQSPFSYQAEALGFKSLGYAADLVKDFPFAAISVNRTWALAHQDVLLRFLAAYRVSVAWFQDPANRNEAVDIFVKTTGTKKPDVELTYDLYKRIGFYDAPLTVDPAGVGDLVKTLGQLGQIEGSTDAARFIDPIISTLTEKK